MKVTVTEAEITNDMDVIATVTLVDENVVKVDIESVLGWQDWLDLTDAVRKVMLMMEVNT